MSLRFTCSNCEEEIIVHYLGVGENAHCRNCHETCRVPEDAVPTELKPDARVRRHRILYRVILSEAKDLSRSGLDFTFEILRGVYPRALHFVQG
ncbi:hypothetical protein ACFLU6_00780 [Acidobacteriota bacterium]